MLEDAQCGIMVLEAAECSEAVDETLQYLAFSTFSALTLWWGTAALHFERRET